MMPLGAIRHGMEIERLITREQLAEALQANPSTIRVWEKQGLPRIKGGHRFIRYQLAEVLAWLKSREQRPVKVAETHDEAAE